MSHPGNDSPKKTQCSKSNKKIAVKERIEYENWTETSKLWSKFRMMFSNNNKSLNNFS